MTRPWVPCSGCGLSCRGCGGVGALLGALLVALSACSGGARPPVVTEAPAVEPAAAPEPEPSIEVPLAEDIAPEGGAMCESSGECGDGEHCRGPAGCGDDWGCGAPRECGDETVSYCGCDATTFYAPSNCPGRSYEHEGPCAPLGEEVDDSSERIEGNAICTSSADCRAGFLCAGTPGCGTLWTCVRRRSVRPRCGRAQARFCGCEGETFEASAECPGQPVLHAGYCPGDEPALAVAEPPPPAEPPSPPAEPPAPAVAVAPPSSGLTPPAAAPPPVVAATPAGCMSNRDCGRGLVCSGGAGCSDEWRCVRPESACVRDTQYFCGCNGATFRASMTCPGRPHRHRGSCRPE